MKKMMRSFGITLAVLLFALLAVNSATSFLLAGCAAEWDCPNGGKAWCETWGYCGGEESCLSNPDYASCKCGITQITVVCPGGSTPLPPMG